MSDDLTKIIDHTVDVTTKGRDVSVTPSNSNFYIEDGGDMSIELLIGKIQGVMEQLCCRIDDTVKRVDDTNSKISRLDDKIDSNLKWTITAFASGFITLAGLIIYLYFKLDERLLHGVAQNITSK